MRPAARDSARAARAIARESYGPCMVNTPSARLPRLAAAVEIADQHPAQRADRAARVSSTSRSSRRAPLSGPIAPSTATTGRPSSAASAAACASRRRATCRAALPCGMTRDLVLGKVAPQHGRRPAATARSRTRRARAARDASRARPRCRCPANSGCAARQAAQTAASVTAPQYGPASVEKGDRRTGEIEIVHGVAVRHVERRQAR